MTKQISSKHTWALLPLITLIIWIFAFQVITPAMEPDANIPSEENLITPDGTEDPGTEIHPDNQDSEVPTQWYCGKAGENDGKNVIGIVSKSEGSADFDILTIIKNPEAVGNNFDMTDFKWVNSDKRYDVPWKDFASNAIKTVNIENGVTSIGTVKVK